jgi:2,4-dienoyl-CoA reductase-like NADH-dependent reductase (Old Yellow Enzyme family)/thioredoxin reductase
MGSNTVEAAIHGQGLTAVDPAKVLFSPFKIGAMRLSNRIVHAPMHTNFADPEGGVTERLLSYIDSQSRGGAGLIYVEHASVEAPRGNNSPITLNVSHERYVAGLAELADVVHANGAKVALQIDHGGRQSSLKSTRNEELISCSNVPWVPSGTIPRAMTVAEIKDMVGKFADAAVRVQFAGFDAVTVHAGHGYLLSSFLSPFANRRNDEYGGSLENRMRFLLEIVAACRQRVGGDYPIICRLNGADHFEGGLENDDVVAIARALEDAGIDALDMTSGTRESGHWQFPPLYVKAGLQLDDVRAVRRVTKLPLIAIGKINTPELAASIVSDDIADLVSFGRELLADAEMPRKIRDRERDKIRPCIYCNDCMMQIRSLRGVACTVNPTLGREKRFAIGASSKPRKVAVIGGGPAGLSAAAWARRRNHEVTLYERDSVLGGNLHLSAMLPYRDEQRRWLDYLIAENNRLGVKVVLNATIDAEKARAINADVLIVSTGRATSRAGFTDAQAVTTVAAALRNPKAVGSRVVVTDVSQNGCEFALLLAENGKAVSLIGTQLAPGVESAVRNALMECIMRSEVKVLEGYTIETIAADSITVIASEGDIQTFAFDTIVSPPPVVKETFADDFSKWSDDVVVIGDASGTTRFMDAVYAGAAAAKRL